MTETVTRYRCAETGWLESSACPAEPESFETCGCEPALFEVVRRPGETPKLVPFNKDADRDGKSTVGGTENPQSRERESR